MPPDVRDCSEEQLGVLLLDALDKAADETPCDFDRATLLGTKARQNKLKFEDRILEDLVMQFLSRSLTPPRVETVAWFLWAFWNEYSQPEPKLIHFLVEYLKSDLPYEEIQEALLLCLAKAFALPIEPDQKKEIYRAFKSVTSASKYESEQPLVLESVDVVLRSSEDS